MPELTREQAAELFDLWLLHGLSRLMTARDKTLGAILASINEAVRINGSGAVPLRLWCDDRRPR